MPSSVAKINTSYDNFLKVRAANLWNCLSKKLKMKSSVESFKHELDCFLLCVPDFPPGCGWIFNCEQ